MTEERLRFPLRERVGAREMEGLRKNSLCLRMPTLFGRVDALMDETMHLVFLFRQVGMRGIRAVWCCSLLWIWQCALCCHALDFLSAANVSAKDLLPFQYAAAMARSRICILRAMGLAVTMALLLSVLLAALGYAIRCFSHLMIYSL